MSNQPVALLVEDDEAWLARLSEYVIASNFRVLAARTIQEGIELCAQEIALVIADLHLRGNVLGGVEVIEHAHRRWPAAKLIIVTTHPSEESKQRASTIGALYVKKQLITQRRLSAVLESLIQGGEGSKHSTEEKSSSNLTNMSTRNTFSPYDIAFAYY